MLPGCRNWLGIRFRSPVSDVMCNSSLGRQAECDKNRRPSLKALPTSRTRLLPRQKIGAEQEGAHSKGRNAHCCRIQHCSVLTRPTIPKMGQFMIRANMVESMHGGSCQDL